MYIKHEEEEELCESSLSWVKFGLGADTEQEGGGNRVVLLLVTYVGFIFLGEVIHGERAFELIQDTHKKSLLQSSFCPSK